MNNVILSVSIGIIAGVLVTDELRPIDRINQTTTQLVKEKRNLDDLLISYTNYIDSPEFNALTSLEKERLRSQRKVMSLYSDHLYYRIWHNRDRHKSRKK